MHDLSAQVRAFLDAYPLIQPGAPVLVAVSGGPDSLCLLHVLRGLAGELGILLHVAHLDHQIRGAESAAEAQFVADLARSWGLPATLAAADVPALAAAEHANLHAVGRAARYAFLARVAHELGAQAVAVAHHANDQAETVLLHLLRGAGPEGLSGMRPVTPWAEWANDSSLPSQTTPALLRPLLGIPRDAIEAYCAAHSLGPRYDPSNHDRTATRNRIRHQLLPQLIEYNPHVIAALGRTAAICADEQDFLAAALDALWPQLVGARPGGIDFAGETWRDMHPALQRAALRRAYAALARGHTLAHEHVEQARAVAGRGVGHQLDLPGRIALHVGYRGFSLGAPPPAEGPQLAVASAALPEAGTLGLGAGWALLVRPGAHAPSADTVWSLQLDAERLPEPLLVRRRAPGDRLRFEGGSRRVQDILTDAKVPRALRDAWPLVAHAAGLVCVVGVRAAPHERAGPESRRVLTLELIRA